MATERPEVSVCGAATWRHRAAELELELPCGAGRHRLRWAAGTLVLADHADLAAERALVALGGPEPACLAMRRLWLEAIADGGFLAEWVDETLLSPSRLSWLGTALERLRLEGYHEFLRRLELRRAERMGQFLYRFPRPWLDRAACAVSEAVTDGAGVSCQDAPGLIVPAVAQRARTAFVTSIGGRLLPWGAAALVPLAVSVVAGAGPAAAGSVSGPARGVRLQVEPSWLHRVWGAGLALVDGRLVLGVEGYESGATVVVLHWSHDHDHDGDHDSDDRGLAPVASVRRCLLARAGEGWTLVDPPPPA